MPTKSVKLAILFFLVGTAYISQAQSIIIQKNINLPQDTVVKNQLMSSLNGFLSQKENTNKDNTFVLKEDLLEASALLDEIKGMENNYQLKGKNFFKPYLTNVVKSGDNNFVIQLAYMGIGMGEPILQASFRLIAKKGDGKYYFSSPLKMNTIAWKTKRINNITYHYRDTLAIADARAFEKTDAAYDKRLKVVNLPEQFYYCNDFADALQLLGVDYKSDYNGRDEDGLTSRENDERLIVSGWADNATRLYAHDLWHSHLHAIVSVAIINRPVDEGCAYLYGGSWGIRWPQILNILKKYAADNPNADWASLYINSIKLRDDDKPIYIAYVLNALIVQKIEKEKGFSPVITLLSCGKRQSGDDNYFAALEKETGITKANFNAAMWELIKNN